MRLFDGHLDLAYLALQGRDLTRGRAECGGALQPAAVTFPDLRRGEVRAAVGTIFIAPRESDTSPADAPVCYDTPQEAHEAAVRQLEVYRGWNKAGQIEIATGTLNPNDEKLQLVLALEGAAEVRDIDDLEMFVAVGVRMVSLTWALGSQWAGGDRTGEGLGPRAGALIKRLDELHCVHDVTHLSERAFWELLDRAQGQVVSSHSNCRALLPGAPFPERHLSDEQLRALAQRHAVMGINLYARFLVPAPDLKNRRATIHDVLRHIAHVEQVTGRRDLLALGSDMDGGFGSDLLPADLDAPEYLHRLAEALSNRGGGGWTDSEIDRFAWSNWAELFAR